MAARRCNAIALPCTSYPQSTIKGHPSNDDGGISDLIVWKVNTVLTEFMEKYVESRGDVEIREKQDHD